MGSGRWSSDVYSAAENYRAATGRSAFAYSDSGARRVHPSLDPRGVTARESRDSDEHPRSTPIAVLFDVTGSMGAVPRVLQTKLPQLLGLLLRKAYVPDPQILFGAVGDATCDRVPLQIGQYESDNRMDEQLENIVLEGGGGGQRHESYELAMYFLARHTDTDAARRGRKGYVFLIGDELPYRAVKAAEVRSVIGDPLAENIPVEAIVAELRRRNHVYYILPTGSYYSGDQDILRRWRQLLGENVLELDDLDAVCETIALTIGLTEDTVDLDEGLADLSDVGSAAGATVGRALTPLARRGRPALPPGRGPGIVRL
ncbi:hypothetical protein [Cryptosporangium aurantiacum]|uniref:VWFA domain-containing protein n=1 Tax=Cryptosporangium aurantiacum TaxID=134849 RepID=A0A1M7KTX4_9ACTN|nr:hypothetical protein [Cryptosporangium aurantiacum]SHM68989.1 hypothetical protein SAMN05443668_1011259 [Cryptosporangium aurantiacum]